MKIGIDARMITYSGIGTRILGLLRSIAKINPSHEIYIFGKREEIESLVPGHKFIIIDYTKRIYGLDELKGHPAMKNMDVLDIPHFNIPIFQLSKSVVTIHDIIPYIFKQYHNSIKKKVYIRLVLNLIKKNVNKVVTVSEFTKSELIKYIGFLPEQIRVIPNAVDHNLFKIRSNSELELFKEKYRLPKSYLLTVGIGKEHKNTDFLVRNLIMLNKKGENLPPLVLGGAGGSIPDYIINSLPSAKEVVIPFPKIPFEELPLLYAGAKLFIFPSLYEGFGFPPLEASACGCPVLASSVASIPEVMHDAAFYFDPTSDEDFQIKFLDLIKNSELLKSKIETGFQNTKKFSWENSAKQMIECWET